jgi:hypothetical protein
MDIIAGIAESFSFNEVCKRSIASRFCSVLCETVSDKNIMSKCGGITLPMGQMSLYVTFAPMMDATIRISLPKEFRIALRGHKTLFF